MIDHDNSPIILELPSQPWKESIEKKRSTTIVIDRWWQHSSIILSSQSIVKRIRGEEKIDDNSIDHDNSSIILELLSQPWKESREEKIDENSRESDSPQNAATFEYPRIAQFLTLSENVTSNVKILNSSSHRSITYQRNIAFCVALRVFLHPLNFYIFERGRRGREKANSRAEESDDTSCFNAKEGGSVSRGARKRWEEEGEREKVD